MSIPLTPFTLFVERSSETPLYRSSRSWAHRSEGLSGKIPGEVVRWDGGTVGVSTVCDVSSFNREVGCRLSGTTARVKGPTSSYVLVEDSDVLGLITRPDPFTGVGGRASGRSWCGLRGDWEPDPEADSTG